MSSDSSSIRQLIEKEMEKASNKSPWYIEALKVVAFMLPFIISFFIYIAALETRISLLESKQDAVKELKEDMKAIKGQLDEIKIQLAKISK